MYNEILTYEFRYEICDMDGGVAKHLLTYWTNLFPDIKDGDFKYRLNDFAPYLESFFICPTKEMNKQYNELFNQILKQGNVTQKGKE